jgi:hypothetical protein
MPVLVQFGACAARGPIETQPARDYAVAFRSGDYAEAARIAEAMPPTDVSAKLVEGMAKSQLGQDAEARALLRPLLRSSNPEIRGRAAATIGLMDRQAGKPEDSAKLLALASKSLSGTDGVWAAHYAAELYQEMGNDSAAAALAARAAPASATVSRAVRGDFTIQFGSFSTEARAERHRRSMALLTKDVGLPQPEVEPVSSGARTLYAVRTGRFGSKDEAASAAASLRTETVVIRTQ